MNVRILAIVVAALLTVPVVGAEKSTLLVSGDAAVLWRPPSDIRTRNLFYGIGGKAHAPHGPFRFVKEDLKGSNPKYNVVDANGVKWKVKLGRESQPETAATRFVWAAGYFAGEDYYLPEIKVSGLPAELGRGKQWVDAGGLMHGARLKREPDGWEKTGIWKWSQNPFEGTREFNGLRTLMALINSWDVKDDNNAIYETKSGERVYIVSDLGATFGAPGFAFPASQAKGNVEQYRKANFVCGESHGLIDFCAPGRPALFRLVTIGQFIGRWHLRWIGRDIPRADAHWMGELLSRLSASQIRDAFRAAGYTPDEVEAFASVMERRIGELTEL